MKNILITGASEGIGFGIAKDLLANDYRVIILDKKKIKTKDLEFKENLIFIKVDLRNIINLKKLFLKLKKKIWKNLWAN